MKGNENNEGKITVLVLDDSSDFRQTTRDMLTGNGFRIVESTGDPKTALECIRTKQPDVVIFDIIHAKTDGIAFLKEALSIRTTKRIRYVVASSITSDVIIKEMMHLGASYYLVKPVNYDILSERLFQLCGKPSSTANAAAPQSILPTPIASDIEEQVTAIILEIGIPAHVKGYHYVRAAIILATEEPDTINAVTKIIYPTIAKQFGTSASRVERAIRHAIEVAWDRGNVDTLTSIFGYSINSNRGKPTNSEFIAMIADRLRLKNKTSSTMPAYRF